MYGKLGRERFSLTLAELVDGAARRQTENVCFHPKLTLLMPAGEQHQRWVQTPPEQWSAIAGIRI